MSDNQEFDINKIAAEFFNENLKNISDLGEKAYKSLSNQLRLRLKRTYTAYLRKVVDKYSKAKSFLIRHEPSNLYSFYVPLGITCGETRISEATIKGITGKGNFAVITGSAGSGKSMMMRHLFLDAAIQKEKVPIFVELKDLNETKVSLLDLIRDKLKKNKFTLDEEYVEKALKAGHFVIFLDGFDEIAFTERERFTKAVHDLVQDYEENFIIVSSRPDPGFGGWQSFAVWQINSLSLEQACELVRKAPFDKDFKTVFIDDLRKNLFDKHQSFLSNPLLLSIMLLIYQKNADIPAKISIFYEQAYQALFQHHDSLKSPFTRKRHSDLDIKAFHKVFSAFSLFTYNKELYRFSRKDALIFLEKAKNITATSFNEDDFLKDAIEAVCLLVDEGLDITFSHRSFQEYFAAQYIRQLSFEKQEKILTKYHWRISDNLITLLHELDQELVEQIELFQLRKLEHILNLNEDFDEVSYVEFLKSKIHGLKIYGSSKDVGTLYSQGGIFLEEIRFSIGIALKDYRKLGGIKRYREFYAKVFEKFNHEIGDKLDEDIPISKILEFEELFYWFEKGPWWYSMKSLKELFRIRKSLINKYKGIEVSIEQELFS